MDNKHFDASLMDYMFSSAYKIHRNKIEDKDSVIEIKDDLTEKEAIQVANELLDVLSNHNLSYKNAYRVSLALTTALATGGIELYKNETK